MRVHALRRNDGRWEISFAGRGQSDSRVIARVPDRFFRFELRTDNRDFRLRIWQNDNSGVERLIANRTGELSDRAYTDAVNGERRTREGITRFRFGTYHHGFRDGRAEVRFRDVRSSVSSNDDV